MNTILFLLLTSCGADPVVLQGDVVGSCAYTSPFSGEPECTEFYGAALAQAEEVCAGYDVDLRVGEPCAVEEVLGTCTYEADGYQVRTTVAGSDGSKCGSQRFGCETFARGVWTPAAACDGVDEIVVLEDPFPLPEQVCVDPLPGEPAGASEDGEVCTWQIVSGATEEGRSFSDYADCDVIRRQRPYSAAPANPRADAVDPRMEDPAYAAEVDWVRDQLRAGSCDCCHSAVAPDGPAVFDADFEGNLLNQFNDRGLAMGAGWIPTIGFGTYLPEENNGFERSSPEDPYLSIIPTTDQARMMAIFEAELEHRGRTIDEFDGDLYGAGPLDAQLNYEPERCTEAEGVDADGVLRWAPGRARYIYVLEAGATSPTVPPNLDLPEGTLWRVDLPREGSPVYSESVTYGQVPDGMFQVHPASGAPPALVPGQDYYLYVTADVLYPISRCVFTAGEPAPSGCSSAGGAGGFAALLAGLALGRRRRRS
ncbi:MAG: hypothetical protein H6739_28510 [Alphaproteobacteria bacterium]|nr:hypothetical protein [Alphaproteobacteria bacterium]